MSLTLMILYSHCIKITLKLNVEQGYLTTRKQGITDSFLAMEKIRRKQQRNTDGQ